MIPRFCSCCTNSPQQSFSASVLSFIVNLCFDSTVFNTSYPSHSVFCSFCSLTFTVCNISASHLKILSDPSLSFLTPLLLPLRDEGFHLCVCYRVYMCVCVCCPGLCWWSLKPWESTHMAVCLPSSPLSPKHCCQRRCTAFKSTGNALKARVHSSRLFLTVAVYLLSASVSAYCLLLLLATSVGARTTK